MDLRYTEEQEMLKRAAKDFLATECTKAMVRELEDDEKGYSPEMWKKMAGLGWMGLFIPEEYGGIEMTFQDFTVLLEEMGYNILPGPFLSTMISTFPIMEGGTEEQKREFLPKIAGGDFILTNAVLEEEDSFLPSGITIEAKHEGDEFVINGKKFFVEMAHVADFLICAARTKKSASPEEGITLFVIDAKSTGINYRLIPTIAANKLFEASFENVHVPKWSVIGEVDKGWPQIENMLRKGAISTCAQSIGAIQACIDMTIDYMKERAQYDRPIGAFQALQHIIANMWINMQTSRYLVYKAVWLESNGLPCEKEVSMAKALVNEAYKDISKWAVRLHGAIGTTWDHDISLYYRRAKAADVAYGGTDYHRETVAQKIGMV